MLIDDIIAELKFDEAMAEKFRSLSNDMELPEMIRKEGDKWCLYSKDGKKKLGTFDTEEAAKKRERQILMFKAMNESSDNLQPIKEAYVPAGIIESCFDDSTLTIRNLAILGKQSLNGYEYSDNAMQKAALLYEGATSYINHQRKSDNGEPRDVRDMIGTYSNIRSDGQKVRGDLQLVDTKLIREEVYPRLKQLFHKLGNSPDQIGRMNDTGTIVEDLSSVNSIDLVTSPATNKNLFESLDMNIPITGGVKQMTLQEILEALKGDKSLAEALKAEVLKEANTAQELETLKRENASLKEESARKDSELDKYHIKEEFERKRDTSLKLIKEAKLPEEFVTDIFKEQLTNCKDEIDMKKLINERVDMVKQLTDKGLNWEKDLTEGKGVISDKVLEKAFNSF